MKDLYSFHASEADLDNFYEEVEVAYKKIFERLSLGDSTLEVFASGGMFSKYSHEFQTLLPVGEDTIYYNKDRTVALNKEVLNEETMQDLGVKREDLQEETAAEVGNIFKLKLKYSEPLGLKYIDQDNKPQAVYMGCYGIGISRLMGVIAEKFADDKGLIWPEEIAPFKYHLIAIGEAGARRVEELYRGHEDSILYDDRDIRTGEKFADADLIGLPYRVVISDRSLAEGGFEMTDRKTGQSSLIKTLD